MKTTTRLVPAKIAAAGCAHVELSTATEGAVRATHLAAALECARALRGQPALAAVQADLGFAANAFAMSGGHRDAAMIQAALAAL